MQAKWFDISPSIKLQFPRLRIRRHHLKYWHLHDSYIARQVNNLDENERSFEMSGRRASVIVHYGPTHPRLSVFFPYFHTGTGPRDVLKVELKPEITIELPSRDISLRQVDTVRFNGILSADFADLPARVDIYPSTTSPAVFCSYTLKNNTGSRLSGRITLKHGKDRAIASMEGDITVSERLLLGDTLSDRIDFQLEEGASLSFSYLVQVSEGEPQVYDAVSELAARYALIDLANSRAEFASEHAELDFMFRLAKLRAIESVFDTTIGPMHSPGGSEYYGGIWCNDQAEYAFPLFPYLGVNNDVALHDYLLLGEKMQEMGKMPYSIESAGYHIGTLDRGDTAMYAYGASLFLLGLGDRAVVDKLLPHIEACIEYEFSRMDESGIVHSETDELERRFPTGDANLATNSLFYSALRLASVVEGIVGIEDKSREYSEAADKLKQDMEAYFGAEVEGFDTYRYYDGNDKLRGWITYPLAMGIYDRAQGTRDALLSDKLWTEHGLRVVSDDETVWERETLYAIRGLWQAGFTGDAAEKLLETAHHYTSGESAPYITETSPAFKQLAAESALFARIITEGLFGIEPQFSNIVIRPRLPEGWQFARIRNVKLLGSDLSIDLNRKDKQVFVMCAFSGKTVFDGPLPESGEIVMN